MPIKQSINRSIDQNKPRNKQTDIVTYNHRMKEQHNFLTQESSEMYGFKIGIFFYDWNKLVWPSSLLFKTSAVRWKQWKSQLQEWEKIRHTSSVCFFFFINRRTQRKLLILASALRISRTVTTFLFQDDWAWQNTQSSTWFYRTPRGGHW